MKQLRSLQGVVILAIIVMFGLACSVPRVTGDDPAQSASTPQVTIASPSAGQKLEPGQEIKVQSTSVDATTGIVRVELLVDNKVVWVDANPEPQANTPYIVAQSWTPDIPGNHVILVQAYNVDNATGRSEPLVVEVITSAQVVDDESSSTGAEAEVNTPTSTPTSTPTGTPTGTPAPLVDTTPLPTATPLPSSTPTITPTPTATPTPGVFEPTGIQPDGRFKDIWQELDGGDSRLGYPTGPEINDRNFARQYFEKGLMFWWDNPDGPGYIWVIDSPADDLRSGSAWNRYADTWQDGDEYACDEARSNGGKGPVRGFGKLWCERPELQNRLGNPLEGEGGSGGTPPYAHVQFYQGGVILYNSLNAEVYVLFDQGDWLRFGY
jgi:hypothetical protein